MREDIDYLRNEIRKRGFMSATQLKIEATRRDLDLNIDNVICKDIKKTYYTNSFVGKDVKKTLYFYCPFQYNKQKGKNNASKKN